MRLRMRQDSQARQKGQTVLRARLPRQTQPGTQGAGQSRRCPPAGQRHLVHRRPIPGPAQRPASRVTGTGRKGRPIAHIRALTGQTEAYEPRTTKAGNAKIGKFAGVVLSDDEVKEYTELKIRTETDNGYY